MALARLRLIEPTPVRSTVLHSLIEPTCCFSCFILISRRSRRPEHVYRDAGISYFSLWRCQMHATWDVRFSFSSTFVWSSVNLRACEHLLLQVLPQAHLTQFQTSVLTSSSIPSINVTKLPSVLPLHSILSSFILHSCIAKTQLMLSGLQRILITR